MEKTPKIVAEEIHLSKIKVVQFKIDVGGFKKAPKNNLAVGHKLLHNLKEEAIKLEMAFSFKNNQENEHLFAQIDFYFRIEKLESLYELSETGIPVFFQPLIAMLLGIALSTARGILFEKLESNGIANIVIPVISPQKLLEQSR